MESKHDPVDICGGCINFEKCNWRETWIGCQEYDDRKADEEKESHNG